MKHFGEHLMLDCYNVKDEILMDKMRIKELFTELIKINNMTPISDFVVYDVDEDSNSKRDFEGLTGFQIIKESHISIHTFKFCKLIIIDLDLKFNLLTRHIISPLTL